MLGIERKPLKRHPIAAVSGNRMHRIRFVAANIRFLEWHALCFILAVEVVFLAFQTNRPEFGKLEAGSDEIVGESVWDSRAGNQSAQSAGGVDRGEYCKRRHATFQGARS